MQGKKQILNILMYQWRGIKTYVGLASLIFFFFNLPGCSWDKFRPLTTGIPQSPDISYQVADIFLPNGQIARDRVDLNRDPFDP